MMIHRVLAATALLASAACATTGALHPDGDSVPHARVSLAPLRADDTVRVIPQAIEPMLPSADRMSRVIAMRLGPQASLDVRYCVSPEGKVTSAELARSSTFEPFDQAVMRDIVAWQFVTQPGPATVKNCQDATILYRPRS